MNEDIRRKNRRLLIVLVVFAVLVVCLVLAWKISIYHQI
jgi:predicted nucleic acid-binding Zn ribbon protein